MIEDALSGKINLILTKSISRFARNTVDTLNTIRKLKQNDVVVYFEKENIYTNDEKMEFLITLLSSIAQEEARSISENVTWAVRKRYEQGKVHVPYKRFLGYNKGNKFEMVINVEQAVVVKKIYKLFLEGYTSFKIAEILSAENIPTPSEKDVWNQTTVRSILTNEKYKGDAILQKRFTVDFLTKKSKYNNGELPQYYVTADHEWIIPPPLFDFVQEKLKERKECVIDGRYSGTRPFTSKIVCGDCGATFVPSKWHSTTYNDLVWQCRNRYKENCKSVPHIYDELLKIAVDTTIKNMISRRKIKKIVLDKMSDDCLKQIKKINIVSDLEDCLIIIEKITVTRDKQMVFEFIDGSEFCYKMPRYSPRSCFNGQP
jgi:DNA invertase Pin-like site-specific DNA recombinase